MADSKPAGPLGSPGTSRVLTEPQSSGSCGTKPKTPSLFAATPVTISSGGTSATLPLMSATTIGPPAGVRLHTSASPSSS